MTPPTTASSPGPDDKSGITEFRLGTGDFFYVRRTVNLIEVFNDEWGELFSHPNHGQPDSVIAQAVRAYQIGKKRGEEAGRAKYRLELLRLLGAQPAKEEG